MRFLYRCENVLFLIDDNSYVEIGADCVHIAALKNYRFICDIGNSRGSALRYDILPARICYANKRDNVYFENSFIFVKQICEKRLNY